jgi:hypothetical protein
MDKIREDLENKVFFYKASSLTDFKKNRDSVSHLEDGIFVKIDGEVGIYFNVGIYPKRVDKKDVKESSIMFPEGLGKKTTDFAIGIDTILYEKDNFDEKELIFPSFTPVLGIPMMCSTMEILKYKNGYFLKNLFGLMKNIGIESLFKNKFSIPEFYLTRKINKKVGPVRD